jgi:hypothetical protein
VKQYTEQEILNAISNSWGNMSRIAQELNCSWITARKYVNMYESCVELYESENNKALDVAEKCLVDGAKNGDIHAAKFIVSTWGVNAGRGKWRTKQSVEITGKEGGAIKVENEVKNGFSLGTLTTEQIQQIISEAGDDNK